MHVFPQPFIQSFLKGFSPPRESGNQDAETYCRHVLFQNQDFKDAALKNLWNEQVNPRIQLLHSLSNKAPAEVQLSVLENCLLSLDQCIAMLTNIQERTPESEPGAKSEPEAVHPVTNGLNQLLSSRKREANAQNLVSYFTIKNSEVFRSSGQFKGSQMVDLKRAFPQINNRFHPLPDYPPKQLLADARTAYLKQLASSVQASPFEQQYEAVYHYLSCLTNPDIHKWIESNIEPWLNAWCCSVIDSCRSLDIVFNPPVLDLGKLSYIGSISDRLARTFMERTLSLFDDTIQLIRSLILAKLFADFHQVKFYAVLHLETKLSPQEIEKRFQTIPPTEGEANTVVELTKTFFDFLQPAWHVLHDSEERILDDKGNVNPEFVQQFTLASKDAARHFQRDHDTTYFEGEIDKRFQVLITIKSGPEVSAPTSESKVPPSITAFLDACVPILDNVLVQLLFRIKQDCKKIVLDATTFISQKLSENFRT